MAKTAALMLMAMLAGCTTGGSGGATTDLGPSAAGIRYALPAASPKLTMQLVLLQCRDVLLVTPVIVVANEAVADPKRQHQLSGSALASALQRREVAVDLYENGTLKSVNATVEDRTGAVFANVFSLITSGLGLFRAVAASGGGGVTCNQQTQAALDEVKTLEEAIGKLRKQLITAAPASAEKIQKQIDALAARVGNLRANELSISAARPLDFSIGIGTPKTIHWTMEDLSKWFAPDPVRAPCSQHDAFKVDAAKVGCEAETDLFAISYEFSGTPASAAEQEDKCAIGALAAPNALPADCERTLVFIEPAKAKVALKAQSENFAGKLRGDTLAETSLLVPQWGAVSYLPLKEGFAGSKNVVIALSPFGGKTGFQWKSQARAEMATAALQPIVTNAAGLVTALRAPDTSDVTQWQQQITELETRLKLNKLIKCEATIQAGGSVCPE